MLNFGGVLKFIHRGESRWRFRQFQKGGDLGAMIRPPTQGIRVAALRHLSFPGGVYIYISY